MANNRPHYISGMINHINRYYNGLLKENLDKLGVSKAYGPLIMEIFHNQGISQADLARRMQFRPPSISVAIQGMEQHGFVIRKPDGHDQRQMNLFLTEKGTNAANGIVSVFEELEQTFLSGLDGEERKLLFKLLSKIERKVPEEHHEI